MFWLLSRVACYWTSHAMAPAASAAELLAGDRQHLDPGLRKPGVRRFVPLVGDDDTGRECDDVVAVVPLRALGLELIARRRNRLQRVDPERLGDRVEERPLGELDLDPAVAVRRVEDRDELLDDRPVERHQGAVSAR